MMFPCRRVYSVVQCISVVFYPLYQLSPGTLGHRIGEIMKVFILDMLLGKQRRGTLNRVVKSSNHASQ